MNVEGPKNVTDACKEVDAQISTVHLHLLTIQRGSLLVPSKSKREGVHHRVRGTCISRFAFAQNIAEVFEFGLDLIKPVISEVFRQVAERPKWF